MSKVANKLNLAAISSIYSRIVKFHSKVSMQMIHDLREDREWRIENRASLTCIVHINSSNHNRLKFLLFSLLLFLDESLPSFFTSCRDKSRFERLLSEVSHQAPEVDSQNRGFGSNNKVRASYT